MWICHFVLVIPQRYINYTLVHISKLLLTFSMNVLFRRNFKTAIFSRFFVHFSRCTRSWKCFFNEHTFYRRKIENCLNHINLVFVFRQYLKFATFSRSTFCSRGELLHFLNKRSWFSGSAKWIQMFLLETCSESLLLYKEDEKSFLVIKPKVNIELQQ